MRGRTSGRCGTAEAIETGAPDALIDMLATMVRAEVKQKVDRVLHLQRHARASVDAVRDYVEVMLGLQVYAHKLYQCIKAEPHESHHQHE